MNISEFSRTLSPVVVCNFQAQAQAVLDTNAIRPNHPAGLLKQLTCLGRIVWPGLDIAALARVDVEIRGAEWAPATEQPVNDPLLVDAVGNGLAHPEVAQDGVRHLVIGRVPGLTRLRYIRSTLGLGALLNLTPAMFSTSGYPPR